MWNASFLLFKAIRLSLICSSHCWCCMHKLFCHQSSTVMSHCNTPAFQCTYLKKKKNISKNTACDELWSLCLMEMSQRLLSKIIRYFTHYKVHLKAGSFLETKVCLIVRNTFYMD